MTRFDMIDVFVSVWHRPFCSRRIKPAALHKSSTCQSSPSPRTCTMTASRWTLRLRSTARVGRQLSAVCTVNSSSPWWLCSLWFRDPGVLLQGSGRTSFSSQIRTVTFEDVPSAYKPGIPFEGKVITVLELAVFTLPQSWVRWCHTTPQHSQ